MMPANVLFTEADLASHVLRMCPHQWQDQYNLQEKGMTPMNMHSLQASLKAIECMCTPEKAHAQSQVAQYWSVLRGPASRARSMGVRILCMLPKIAAGTRKTEQ
jgi:hypothetical protein